LHDSDTRYVNGCGETMRIILTVALTVLCAAAEVPSEPPLLVHLIRIPGGDPGVIRPYASAKAQVNVFGLRAVTGISETWLLEGHDSFQSIEDLDKAIQSVLPPGGSGPPDRPEQTSLIALYRPNWSYRPDLAIKAFAKARYFQVSIRRIRPGADSDFGDLMKMRQSGLDRINLDRPDIVYQVVSGAPAEMFIVLAPLPSLKTIDDALVRVAGTAESGQRPGNKIVADIELSRENLLLRIEPRISWVNQSFVEADPEFWQAKASK
jgi:hypothetical protein